MKLLYLAVYSQYSKKKASRLSALQAGCHWFKPSIAHSFQRLRSRSHTQIILKLSLIEVFGVYLFTPKVGEY